MVVGNAPNLEGEGISENQDDMVYSPPCSQKFRGVKLASYGLPPLGTSTVHSPLFSDLDDKPNQLLVDKFERQQQVGPNGVDSRAMYPKVLAYSPLSTPTNPYNLANQKTNINEKANETIIFSCNREEAWDGYDSALDESDASEVNSDATPPDEMSEQAGAASKVAISAQVQRSFHRDDINNHKRQLKDNAPLDKIIPSHSPLGPKETAPPPAEAPGPCDWAQVGGCTLSKELPPLTCQHQGCSKRVHHFCQIQWEICHGMIEESILRRCCQHHINFQEMGKLIVGDFQEAHKLIADQEVQKIIAEDFQEVKKLITEDSSILAMGACTLLARAVVDNTAMRGPAQMTLVKQDVDQCAEDSLGSGKGKEEGTGEAMDAVVITDNHALAAGTPLEYDGDLLAENLTGSVNRKEEGISEAWM